VEDDIDEELGELGLNLGHKTQPKEWIELQPYTYQHWKTKF
jgi:hypothetical protein